MPVRLPILMPNGNTQDQDCLTVAELADLLRTTKDTVYRRVAAHQWPCYKPVRTVYFTPEDVRAILAMAHHGANGAQP